MLTHQLLTDRINTLLYLGFEKNENLFAKRDFSLDYSIEEIQSYTVDQWEIEMDFIEYVLSK